MDDLPLFALDADALEAEVRRHNRLYWDNATPEISDEAYDLLVQRLRQLRPDSPVLRELGESRSDESDAVAAADEDALRALPSGAKVTHLAPMLSLDKCYSEDELHKWFDRFDGHALASPKVDGVAMSVRYDARGELLVGATRGSGLVGDVITDNVRHVIGVPTKIAQGPLEVRGETYLPLSTFRKRFAADFANPRNLTAGALKQKDAANTGAYGLHFFAYDGLGLDLPTEEAKRERLQELGFTPVPAIAATRDSGQSVFDAYSAARESDDFETDGVVFKVADVAQHATMGATSHHPRYAIAYKFQGESGFTTLEDVLWSVSRTGSINPVACLAAVSLSGVTVTRASLHNLGIIEALAGLEPGTLVVGENAAALSPGARVLITRRGGVIPHVESIADAGHGRLDIPSVCPSCGAPTRRDGDLVVADHLPTCATQAVRKLIHFVALTDMDGVGPKLLEQLFEAGTVVAPADLYALTLDDLLPLERMAKKSADNVLAAIADKRTIGLATFLAALGIEDLGPSMARKLAAAHPALDAIRSADAETLVAIDGFGEIVAQKVVDGLAAWSDGIDALLEHITLEAPAPPAEADASLPLSGRAIVFTGKMTSMGRSDAQRAARAAGAETPSSVSKAVTHLVLGDGDYPRYEAGWRSSKLKKAEQLIEGGAALEIVSESTFRSWIGEDSD